MKIIIAILYSIISLSVIFVNADSVSKAPKEDALIATLLLALFGPLLMLSNIITQILEVFIPSDDEGGLM